jgi:P-type Cu+ transporter
LSKAQSQHLAGVPQQDHEEDRGYSLDRTEVLRILFVAAAAGAFWYFGRSAYPYLTALGVVCTLVGGLPIFHEAYENIIQRRMTMELSTAIAIVAALAIREFFTAQVITLFVLVAEILEGLTVDRGRKAIRHLVDLLPATATVRRNGSWRDVETSEVAAGEVVLVKPGARIPVDGVVAGGRSFVDQATITGESMPAEKSDGAPVYAGTINQSGALEIQVDRVGRDTTFGKIIDAVERAEKSRAPIQGIADRLAGYLVYFALAAAAATFLITHNVRSTISVVIVAGACGIAAGTPLAILGDSALAAARSSAATVVRETSRSGGLAEERVACKRLAQTGSAIHLRLAIADQSGTQWFGEITEFWQYQAIVDWAGRSRDAGQLLPLPEEFRRHMLRPFPYGTLADFPD